LSHNRNQAETKKFGSFGAETVTETEFRSDSIPDTGSVRGTKYLDIVNKKVVKPPCLIIKMEIKNT